MDSASLQYLLGVSPAQLTFTDDNPLLNVITVTTTVIAAVYVLGLSTGNHSFVDKCWSIVPVYYAWQFGLAELSCASPAGFPRAAVAACIITVWGLRLSYNFYRKGGYKVRSRSSRRVSALRLVSVSRPHHLTHHRISLFVFIGTARTTAGRCCVTRCPRPCTTSSTFSSSPSRKTCC